MLLVITACGDDEIPSIEVQQELQPYFDRFVGEAELRGVNVDFRSSGISGEILDIEGSIAGQCVTQNDGMKVVRMDRAVWERITDLEKEFLVFHELGHCFLDRGHLDTADSQGRCTSVMNSGEGQCLSNYSTSTREDYLNELFAY